MAYLLFSNANHGKALHRMIGGRLEWFGNSTTLLTKEAYSPAISRYSDSNKVVGVIIVNESKVLRAHNSLNMIGGSVTLLHSSVFSDFTSNYASTVGVVGTVVNIEQEIATIQWANGALTLHSIGDTSVGNLLILGNNRYNVPISLRVFLKKSMEGSCELYYL